MSTMSNRTDGGPAFPQISFDEAGLASKAMQGGVSVRDYFAAAALQGLLSFSSYDAIAWPDEDNQCRIDVRIAYRYADAMLAERQKEAPNA